MEDNYDFCVSLDEQIEIQNLAFLYRKEARKCSFFRAHLSGCILIGAAFEALLLASINSFPEYVIESNNAPRTRNKKIKALKKWTLGELINVSKEIGLLTTPNLENSNWQNIEVNPENYYEVVQKTRNLVHPVKYMDEVGKKRITKKQLEICFEIVYSASDCLYKALK